MTKNKKVKPVFYISPELNAKLEMYRRTAFAVPVSRTAFYEFIFNKFLKENGIEVKNK